MSIPIKIMKKFMLFLREKGKSLLMEKMWNLRREIGFVFLLRGKRQFFAAEDSAISFACIQVKEHSLEGYTADDAVIQN